LFSVRDLTLHAILQNFKLQSFKLHDSNFSTCSGLESSLPNAWLYINN